MCDEPNLCIDTMRGDHESSEEWNLRRKFLVLHKDTMPFDQLVCMTNCFVNVYIYGCKYPAPVMQKLQGLTSNISDDIKCFKQTHRRLDTVKFVKATDSHLNVKNNEFSKTTKDFKNLCDQKPTASAELTRRGGIAFVQSTKQYQSTDIDFDNMVDTKATKPGYGRMPVDSKFHNLQGHIHKNLNTNINDNAVSILYMAADRAKMTISVEFLVQPDKQHAAILTADFVQVAKEVAATKKTAKKNACESAVHLLCKKYLWLEQSTANNFILRSSNDDNYTAIQKTIPPLIPVNKHCSEQSKKQIRPCQKRKATPNSVYGNFVLYEPKEKCLGNIEVQILNMSANFNQASLSFDCSRRGPNVFCQITIEGEVIADATGSIEREAKTAAAKKVLIKLRKTNYTVQLKRRQDDIGKGITKDELIDSDNKQLPDSNIGSKLLKMMGWTGGGIGKEGQGIAEPVSLESVINREGLGLKAEQGITQDFRVKIKKILNDYARSNDEKELVFSSQFSKDERSIIHKEGQALRLKTKSFNQQIGTKKERYLVISRKRGRFQLVQYLQSQGGESEQYLLIPPGTHEDLTD